MLKISRSKNDWEQALLVIGEHIFWKFDYYQLYRDQGIAEAAIYETKNGLLFYPYLKRKLDMENRLDHSNGILYDITTAYGYGGPKLKFTGDEANQKAFIEEFYHHFDKYCRNANIVSEFVRFHPLEINPTHFQTVLDVKLRNNNIVVPINKFRSEEQALLHYKHSTRKSIKKAIRNDVKIIVDDKAAHFPEFYSIYLQTLNRNDADEIYYYKEFFFSEINQFKKNVVYFHAMKDQKVIASELLLYDDYCIYSFLGGTISDYFHLSPNHLLKHQVVLWGMANKIPVYLLGGGYKVDDGIYQYKKTFSPNCKLSYYTGERIIISSLYKKLCKQSNTFGLKNDYFPLYRYKP